MASKLGEGDIKGRIFFSSDLVAPYSTETVAALESEQLAPANDLTFPSDPETNSLEITGNQHLREAVSSFRSAFAGSMDGLPPRHKHGIICASAGENGESFVGADGSL